VGEGWTGARPMKMIARVPSTQGKVREKVETRSDGANVTGIFVTKKKQDLEFRQL